MVSDNSAELPDLPELYQVIRVGLPEAPVPAMADVEAWQARERHPELRTRAPWYGVAEEELGGCWRVLDIDDMEPQNCRDTLAHICRLREKDAKDQGDTDAARAWEAGYRTMDRFKANELTVRDSRFRIIRGEYFFRVGPQGPEPPRPSDPDSAPIGPGQPGRDPAKDHLLDPTVATGISEALLKFDFMNASYPPGVPPDVRADSLRAMDTHPGGVLLPAAFAVFEETPSHWTSRGRGHETPQAARDALTSSLAAMLPARVRIWSERMDELPEEMRLSIARRDGYLAPGDADLTEKQMRRIATAVQRLEAERIDEITVLRHRYRIVRLERFVRLGPEGPEPPRPSDYDELQPIEIQTEQDRAAGYYDDEEDEEPGGGGGAEPGPAGS